jgi:hypothetical protein
MKKLSLFALSALVGTGVVLGTSPQLPVAAATPASATLLATGNSAVGDSGLGQAWGVDTTLVDSTRWTVFESSASDLVLNDTNNASDIFVTNGTTTTRLSVSASGTEGSVSANSFDPTICGTGRKVVFTTENEWDELTPPEPKMSMSLTATLMLMEPLTNLRRRPTLKLCRQF